MESDFSRVDWRLTDEEREHYRKIAFDRTTKQLNEAAARKREREQKQLDEAAAKEREREQRQSFSTNKARAEVAVESPDDDKTEETTSRTFQAQLRGAAPRDRPESSSSTSSESLLKTFNARQERRAKPVDPSTHRQSDSSGPNLGPLQRADEVEQPDAAQVSSSTAQTPVTARAPQPAGVKRPAPATDVPDDRRLSGIKAAKRPSTTSSSASPKSPPSEDERKPPQWYRDLPKPDNKRGREGGNADTALLYLKDRIGKAKQHHLLHAHYDLRQDFREARTKLHQIAFIQVDQKLLRKKRMMENEYGLPQIFDTRYSGGVDWPYDIKADAEELYNKWYREDFDTDIVRDIDFKTGTASGGNKVKPGKQRNAKVEGHNGLVNGQWWPALICAVRDGAHGATVAGIAGVRGKGAYSCFMAGGASDSGKYPDIDEGEVVKYCGTETSPGASEVTDSTALMIESKLNKIPVRFMRSSKAKGKSKYAPSEGFRYDGLYDVVEYEVLDQRIHQYRFTLKRQPGQGPIRGGEGNPCARPTFEEVQEYKKHKMLASGRMG